MATTTPITPEPEPISFAGKRVSKQAVDTVVSRLAPLLGARLTTAKGVLEEHGHDESWHHPAAPDAVCFAENTEEVATIVRACSEYQCRFWPTASAPRSRGRSSPNTAASAWTCRA